MKQLRLRFLFLCVSFLMNNSAFGQELFIFEPFQYGDVAWGDFTNDNYPDVLISGKSDDGKITKIYKNNAPNADGFTELTDVELPGLDFSSVAWFDYNDDSNLDFLIAGKDNDNVAVIKLYKNNGDETFTEITNTGLTPLISGSIVCFDYDNDNYVDVLVGGFSEDNNDMLKLFKNNGGNGTFTEQNNIGIVSGGDHTVAVGDYNNDGYKDILQKGNIYENNGGDGTFTNQNFATAADVGLFFDYDGDLYPDLILSNSMGSGKTIIYKNNTFDVVPTFIPIDTIATTDTQGDIAVLDYDEDGDLDIIIVGDTATGKPNAELYINNFVDGSFDLDESVSIYPVRQISNIACDDYNQDGITDFILNGSNSESPITQLYTGMPGGFSRNELPLLDHFERFDDIVNVKESAVAFSDFDKDGLPDLLVCGKDKDSNPQSILYKNTGKSLFLEQTKVNIVGVSDGSVNWGDYNNDGFPDILLFGKSENGNVGKIYKNNGNGTFSEQTQISLPQVMNSAVAWEDYTGDGLLDILVTGQDDNDVVISKIYKNDGNGNYSEQTQISLTGVWQGAVAWGDYNKDGYKDILVTGQDESDNLISKIYKNDGNGNFEEQTQISLTGIGASSVAWGDYDNDGWLDILFTGAIIDEGVDNLIGVSKIYKNDRNGNFEEQTQINLTGVYFSSAKWFDYDKDDDLDIIITGQGSGLGFSGQVYSMIYKNSGNGTFAEQTQIELFNLRKGAVDYADINQDGYVDLILTGEAIVGGEQIPKSKIYINDKNGGFKGVEYRLAALNKSFISIADYNKDGYKDILLTGQNKDSVQNAYLYAANDFGFLDVQVSLPTLKDGATSWGDYNNDGYCDLIMTGTDQLGLAQTRVLQNSGKNKFIESGIYVTGVYGAAAEWADYNNDGLIDFILSGNTGSNLIAKIYRNTGNGFIETTTSLPGANRAQWSDCNNDGLWDIVLVDVDATIKIYKNKGNDEFQLVQNLGELENINFLDLSVEDYNLDGYDDLLILKNYRDFSDRASLFLYENNKDGTFGAQKTLFDDKHLASSSLNYIANGDFNNEGKPEILLNNQEINGDPILELYELSATNDLDEPMIIPAAYSGGSTFNDFDGDGDLDVVVAGNYRDGLITETYYNKGTTFNTAPTPPSNLQFEINADTVFLSWDKGTDTETLQAALTYNCYIYELDGDTIWHSMSNLTTGELYLQKHGNTGHNTHWSINNLEVGKWYAWSVQTVDNGYKGSTFAPEMQFRLAPKFIVQPEDKTVCEASFVIIRATTTGTDSYQWQLNKGNEFEDIENDETYNNANSSDLSIQNIDTIMNNYKYRCIATTIGGSSTSTEAVLHVDKKILSNAGDDGGVCVATEYRLSASDPVTATGTWTCDLQQVSFSDIHSPTATVLGLPEGNTNLVWTVLQDNVCGANSDIMVVTRKTTGSEPTKPNAPIGVTEVCKGSNLDFSTVEVANSDSYVWTVEPAEAGVVSGNSTVANVSWEENFNGTAQIKVSAKNTCGTSVWSDALQVDVSEKNAQDILAKSEILLFSPDAGYQYQWFLNGNAIAGAQKQYYYNADMQAGDYQVEVTFHQNCKRLTEVFANGSRKKSLAESIKIYPNPATNSTHIEIDNDYLGKIKFKLSNNLGKVYESKSLQKDIKQIDFDKKLSGLPPGIYLFEFIFNDNQKVSKQVVVK